MTKSPPTPWQTVLRSYRKANGWTQLQAARNCSVALRTWIGWENAQRVPSRITRRLITLTCPGIELPENS